MVKHPKSNVATLKKEKDKEAEIRLTKETIDWLLALDIVLQ